MDDSITQLKTLSRQHLRLIWELAQAGGSLNAEDGRIAQVMREHPEYADLWPRLDGLTDADIEQDGVNPLLHITVHGIIENQLAESSPKDVGPAVEALMKQGFSRHNAIHRVGQEFTAELFPVLKYRRPFDIQAYERRLAKLIQGPARRGPARRKRKRGR